MTEDDGQRIATTDGAMLADTISLGNVPGIAANVAAGYFFEPAFWAQRGELCDVSGGRGSAWFVSAPPNEWALRHYRRGGFIANLSSDGYLWAGEGRVRSFAEWHLLAALARRKLPVPKPIAARYQRRGLVYRCDLITLRIPGAEPLSSLLTRAALPVGIWREIGVTVARFHDAGVDHADLNAHNILVDGAGRISLIDFDRCACRDPGAWAMQNLARLRRSLLKVSRAWPTDRFSAATWDLFLESYESTRRAGLS